MSVKDRMRKRRWGVFNHYICTPGSEKFYPGTNLLDWNKTVSRLDVDKVAYNLHKMGAGYYFITLIHGTHYMLAPNDTYEEILGVEKGTFCSKRDVVEELYYALKKYDIDLCLYFNCLSPFNTSFDRKSRATLTGVDIETSCVSQKDVFDICDGIKFVEKWSKILKEFAVRYGDKVKMWWLDSCYDYSGYTEELLKYYHDAIKAGNPDALIGFNKAELIVNFDGGLKKSCKYEELTCGENNFFNYIPPSGEIDGALTHLLIPIGVDQKVFAGPWGARDTEYTNEFLKEYIDKVNEVGGIVTLDIHIEPDGSFDEKQVSVLKNI